MPPLASKSGSTKGKGKGKEANLELNILNNGGSGNNNDDNNWPAATSPTSPTGPTLISPPLPSSTSASSSKRKHSTLGINDSGTSTSQCGSGKKSRSGIPGPIAIQNMSVGVAHMGNSVNSLVNECKLYREYQERYASTKLAADLSAKCQEEAQDRLHDLMIWKLEILQDKPEALVALINLVSRDQVLADMYLSLREDKQHVAWVKMRLKEMGYTSKFMEGITISK